jgi:CHAT domain-containing protein
MLSAQTIDATETFSSQNVNSLQLLQQGWELYQAEKFAEAVKVLQQASQALQSQGDKLNQALALNYLSLAAQQLGQWPEATKAIANSLTLLKASSNIRNKEHTSVLAQALNTQGQLQLALGQSEKALGSWEQAHNAYTQISDTAGIIGSQINQAQALQALGLYRRTLITLTQVNQNLQQQPDSLLKATGLLSLGNILRLVGNLDRENANHSLGSRQILEQSLAVAQRLKSPELVAEIQLSLGNTARTQQQVEAALEFYRQASTSSASPMTRLQAQLNQLQVLLEQEQWVSAQTLLPTIQSELTTLAPSRKAIYAQIKFAQSLIRFNQASNDRVSSSIEIGKLLATAIQQAKTIQDQRAEAYALGNLGGLYEQTQQWSTAKDLTQQALILAQSINAPDISYRWQWQLGRLLKYQGNNQGAIAAYTQAVTTLQSLRQDLVAINPEIQFSFREEVEPVYRQLVDLILQSKENSQPSQEKLIQARNLIESLQLAELDNFFRVACLEGKPIQIDQVIDKDDPTATVIYPIILPDRLEVILKLPQQPLRHYKVAITQTEVETTIEKLQEKLIKPYMSRDIKALSRQLYSWLIQPAAADLAKSKVKTLVFVLDGSLRNIPMAVLYDGQQYLIQKYAIALTPGLQLLPSKSVQQLQIQALSAGLTEARHGFSPLANVGLELNQIKSEVSSSKILLNQQFTSTSLQKEINSLPFPVVHLATHGQFSSQAEKTFILAWDKPIIVNELDSFLRTRNTSSRNAIELLVLSACQTAVGDKRAALGLAGVAVRAGARSTLASLWNIDDESTALLMSHFYEELAKNKLNKAEALRQAQLTLLNNPNYEIPRFWAPYVLVGNWQ